MTLRLPCHSPCAEFLVGVPFHLCQLWRDQPQETCFREGGSIYKPVLCISGGGGTRSIPLRPPMIQVRVPCGWEGGGFNPGPRRPTSVVTSPWTLRLRLGVHLAAALPKQFMGPGGPGPPVRGWGLRRPQAASRQRRHWTKPLTVLCHLSSPACPRLSGGSHLDDHRGSWGSHCRP